MAAKRSFAQQAAMCSWLCPIFAFVIGWVQTTNRQSANTADGRIIAMALSVLQLLFLLSGVVLGIVALAKAKGQPGVHTPAIVGLCISGGLLLLSAAGAVLFFR